MNYQAEIDDDVTLDPEESNALRVTSDTRVKRWVKRLRKVLSEMPDGLFIATGYDSATIHAMTPDGECSHGHGTIVASLPGKWRAS